MFCGGYKTSNPLKLYKKKKKTHTHNSICLSIPKSNFQSSKFIPLTQGAEEGEKERITGKVYFYFATFVLVFNHVIFYCRFLE